MNKSRSRGLLVPPLSIHRRYAATLPVGDMLALDALFALRATAQGVENTLSQWLGKDALSPGRWQVLVVLWSSDKPIPQHDIVRVLKVSRPTISALVETLSTEGHVTVTPDGDDKRQMLVELTPAGKAMTARLVRENATRLRQTFRGVSDEDLRQLIVLLTRLTQSV